MNPLTNTRNITKLNEREINLGIKENSSWHNEYKDSAWIFVGGLSYELTEGDILCVFSQYGEIVNINLVRDKKTGKTKGFCFICYEDQRSTILAVDNFNGIKLCSRTIRVDHVANYRIPKDGDDVDDETQKLRREGCAPTVVIKKPSSSDPVSKQLRKENDQKWDMDKREKKKTKIYIKTEEKDPEYDKYEIPSISGYNDKTRHSDAVADQHLQKPEIDSTISSKRKKSKHSSKESHRSHRHHTDYETNDDKTHKNRHRPKHLKHTH